MKESDSDRAARSQPSEAGEGEDIRRLIREAGPREEPPAEDMARILSARRREAAGRTAPAHGLVLVAVRY